MDGVEWSIEHVQTDFYATVQKMSIQMIWS